MLASAKRTRVRYGRVRNKGYRVHQRCCQALSFHAFLACARKRKAKAETGCAMGKDKAHPGALWEGEKQRFSGSSALLPSLNFPGSLVRVRKQQGAPGCAMGKHKAHPGGLSEGQVHQRCCQALGFPGSLACARKHMKTQTARGCASKGSKSVSGSNRLLEPKTLLQPIPRTIRSVFVDNHKAGNRRRS